MPIASASTLSCDPMCPYPIMPKVLALISQHLALTLFHVPACISMLRSPSWRASVIISPIMSSATEREFEKGELKTQIPCEDAYLRSTWFVPMQKQPTAMRFFASARTRAVSLVLERMPRTLTSLVRTDLVLVSQRGETVQSIPNFLDKLVFRQRRLQRF